MGRDVARLHCAMLDTSGEQLVPTPTQQGHRVRKVLSFFDAEQLVLVQQLADSAKTLNAHGHTLEDHRGEVRRQAGIDGNQRCILSRHNGPRSGPGTGDHDHS